MVDVGRAPRIMPSQRHKVSCSAKMSLHTNYGPLIIIWDHNSAKTNSSKDHFLSFRILTVLK
uniref:Uncharacterized protein n=1 Tax=Rhizophora mucronata TaxID=61149 RepID=A0A2P2R2R9_RHIMU